MSCGGQNDLFDLLERSNWMKISDAKLQRQKNGALGRNIRSTVF